MKETMRSGWPISAMAMPAVTLLLGLWHVGWSPAAFPAWFWPALLGVALAGAASAWLQTYGLRQTGTLARTFYTGLGWGLAVMATLGVVNSLDGPLGPAFFIVWPLGALAYGYWVQSKDAQRRAA